MHGRHVGGNAKKIRRVKKTATLKTAMGSLHNRDFRNVRRGRRHL